MSRRIRGLSPIHPRGPPVCSTLGCSQRCSAISARSSRRRRSFRRCRGCRCERRAPRGGACGEDRATQSARTGRTSPGDRRPGPRRVGSRLARGRSRRLAVGVALAEDRDEAADHAGEAVAGGVRLDQPLAGELRCAVERCLDRERSVLGRREDLRLAVDRAGGGERDLLTSCARIASSTFEVAIVFCSRSRADARARSARRRWPAGGRPSHSPRTRRRARPCRARRPRRGVTVAVAGARPRTRAAGAEVVDDHDLDILGSGGRRGCCR